MKLLSKIKKTIKKKHEKIVFDLFLNDYDNSNFYFALVYNKRIEKYKILFVPIDAINMGESVEDYFCYQFIYSNVVDNIIDRLLNNRSLYENENYRNRKIKDMDSYYIEININLNDEIYPFFFTQFIDDDCLFLFDIIVTIFEYSPHIVNELCIKLLSAFGSKKEAFHYILSIKSSLQNIDNYFKDKALDISNYSIKNVKFLEQIGSRYYGVVNNNLIVIDYNKSKELINVATESGSIKEEELYLVLKAIQDNYFRDFYRLHIVDNSLDFKRNGVGEYYLSYGILDDKFKIIDASKQSKVPLSLLKKKLIKIIGMDDTLEKNIIDYLNSSYEDYKVKELIEFIKEVD